MSKGKQEAQGSLPRERCIALVHTVHRLQPMPAGVIPLRAGQARTHAVQDSRGLTALVLEMALKGCHQADMDLKDSFAFTPD